MLIQYFSELFYRLLLHHSPTVPWLYIIMVPPAVKPAEGRFHSYLSEMERDGVKSIQPEAYEAFQCLQFTLDFLHQDNA